MRFYSEVEEIPYFRAYRDLMIKNFEFLGEDIPEQIKEERQLELDTSRLIPLNIESGYSEDPDVLRAWSLLFERKLSLYHQPNLQIDARRQSLRLSPPQRLRL